MEAQELEAKARVFWEKINSRLDENNRLSEEDITNILHSASGDGLSVMINDVLDNTSYVTLRTIVRNFISLYPCKTCVREMFGEGFNMSYARDPLANIERIRKDHADHITETPLGAYNINEQIAGDLDKALALAAQE